MQVQSAVEMAWPVETQWGTFVFEQGGSIEIVVVESSLERFHGQIPYRAEVLTTVPVKFSGELNGEYSGETEVATGTLTGALDEDVAIPLGEDQVVLEAGSSLQAEVADSALDTVTMKAESKYIRQGTELLQGSIPEAVYHAQSGLVDGSGDLTLLTTLEKSPRTENGSTCFSRGVPSVSEWRPQR